MQIAILASDMKKELMADFCIAYCGILSKHSLCATATTAKYISEATGLTIEGQLAGAHGGLEMITSRISFDEIDLVLYFRDPSDIDDYSTSEQSLILKCDLQSVPVATNIATAEALILALARGDLDWRENMKKKQDKPVVKPKHSKG